MRFARVVKICPMHGIGYWPTGYHLRLVCLPKDRKATEQRSACMEQDRKACANYVLESNLI